MLMLPCHPARKYRQYLDCKSQNAETINHFAVCRSGCFDRCDKLGLLCDGDRKLLAVLALFLLLVFIPMRLISIM